MKSKNRYHIVTVSRINIPEGEDFDSAKHCVYLSDFCSTLETANAILKARLKNSPMDWGQIWKQTYCGRTHGWQTFRGFSGMVCPLIQV